jgi:hypothetical protein
MCNNNFSKVMPSGNGRKEEEKEKNEIEHCIISLTKFALSRAHCSISVSLTYSPTVGRGKSSTLLWWNHQKRVIYKKIKNARLLNVENIKFVPRHS